MRNVVSFTLITNMEGKGETRIQNPSVKDICKALDAFDFNKWNYIVLEPTEPIDNSVYLLVGTCCRRDEDGNVIKSYDAEMRLEYDDDGFRQYAITTDDLDKVKGWVEAYLLEGRLPNLSSWTDITEDLEKEEAEAVQNIAPPILDYIRAHIQDDGTLPPDFSINAVYESGRHGISFVDGFWDGTITYHVAPDEQDPEPIYEVLRLISQADYEAAIDGLNSYFFDMRNANMLSIIDDISEWLIEHEEELDVNNLASFAANMITFSRNVEVIKFSLALLGACDLGGIDELAACIQDLARCDEFTLFCVFAVQDWPNENELIFEMVKHVFGWGRVLALEWLEPETEEIKRWLLTEGYRCNWEQEYPALRIAKTVDLADLLQRGSLPEDEYKGVGEIIGTLLLEDEAPGLSDLEDKDVILEAFLREMVKHTRTVEHFELVLHILQYVHPWEESPAQYRIKQMCGDILVTPECRDTVEAAFKTGRGFYLAAAMNMECRQAAVNCIERDPLENIHVLEYALGDDRQINERLIGLYEKALPLYEIATGPDELFAFGHELSKSFLILSQVLQHLHGYDGLGEKLVICALQSPVVNNRHMALNVVKSWREQGGMLSPALKKAIKKLNKTEINEHIIEELKDI